MIRELNEEEEEEEKKTAAIVRRSRKSREAIGRRALSKADCALFFFPSSAGNQRPAEDLFFRDEDK